MTRKAARGGEVSDLAQLEMRLGHRFRDPDLARQALTHRSFGTPHNERLEFLGDALLNCSVATILYERFPQLPEGDLSRLRAALVNQGSLSEVAVMLGLGDRLRLGEGELKSGGFRRPSILADALEALLGSVFLDAGFDATRRVVATLLTDKLDSAADKPVDKDPKTALQEHLQASERPLPEYRVTGARGPDHRKQFQVAVIVAGEVLGEAIGPSKKEAEQEAARLALLKLGNGAR